MRILTVGLLAVGFCLDLGHSSGAFADGFACEKTKKVKSLGECTRKERCPNGTKSIWQSNCVWYGKQPTGCGPNPGVALPELTGWRYSTMCERAFPD